MDVVAQVGIPVLCVLVGLLVGRALERVGKLRFRSSAWRFGYKRHNKPMGFDFGTVDPSNATKVEYDCRIEIFNGTDKATALNAFLVEFRLGRETLLSDKPYCVRYRTKEGAWVPRVGAESVNLPPREWTTMHLWGHLSEKHAADIRGRGKTSAHFTARLPSGKRKRWRMDDCAPKA